MVPRRLTDRVRTFYKFLATAVMELHQFEVPAKKNSVLDIRGGYRAVRPVRCSYLRQIEIKNPLERKTFVFFS